ncbi:MAG: hypothetical protein J6K61_02510 [Clostridia bacterium]|nr:hypothetical protein [Clostridia bacterium]
MKKKLYISLFLVVVLLFTSTLIMSVSAAEATADFCPETEDGKHLPGLGATCTNAQLCRKCGFVIEPQRPHAFDEATCAAPKMCRVCGKREGKRLDCDPATYTREEATCTEPVECGYCHRIIEEALGHEPGAAADCGHAQFCTVCCFPLVNATGKHTFTGEVTVIKQATAEGYGEYAATCSTCGEDCVMHYTNHVTSSDAKVLTAGGTAKLTPGSYLSMTALKVANYKDVSLANKYSMIQVANIDLYDSEDAVYEPNGTLTVKMLLNKSAVKFTKEDLKLYHIADDGKATEVDILAIEDGYVVFETDHFSVFALAVENEAGVSVLGGSAGLPLGAIIGIVAGVIVLAGAAVAVILVMKKKNSKAAE